MKEFHQFSHLFPLNFWARFLLFFEIGATVLRNTSSI